VVLSPRDLALALDRHGVTTLFLTTALFNQVAREAPGAFRRVRDCLVGGETLDPRWVAEVLRLAPPLRLLNVYGPTETTTFASWHEVKAVPPGVVTIPIGRPIGNTELYVLDRHLCPVPAGVVGELWIGGAGLARGYLNRPALTAERFVSHPFSDEPGARLYRTGDLARRRADGAIEFVGRVDHQVKIRGHRVEPGEVEAALRRHPEVSEALVTARDHPVAGRQLVAYVGIGSGRGPEPAELRAFLRERLPEFMVPAVFVLLDRLPLTANGKVDREALPAPAEGRAPRAERLVAGPRSPLDRLLVQIWEDLLGVSPVGITDDFFDLGGHSLLAVRMVDAVERACGVRPALSALFERATVEHLASALLQADAGARHAPAAAVKASGSRPPFFFLHGDYTGGGLYCRGLASRMEPEQPFWVLHPHGLDGGPVPSSIEAMAADHVRTLRQVVPHGPYLLGGHCNGGLVALEMARQLRQAGEAVPLLVLLDATAPGRWERRLLEALGALGRLRGLDDARLRDVRMWLREIPPRLRERGRYCRTRARLIMRGGAGELMALLGRKLSGRRMPARATPEAPGSQGAGGDDGVHRAYRRAVLRYLPRRYPGRLTVIRCAGTHPDRADLGWSRLADGVEMHVVPGDHFGALTQHAGALGDKLAECLRRALSA
jgi:thioesterase domain-containing protein/acyl carrier protein